MSVWLGVQARVSVTVKVRVNVIVRVRVRGREDACRESPPPPIGGLGAGRGVPFILASRMKHVSQGERVCCFDVCVRKTNSPEHTRLVQVGAWGEQKAFVSTHVFLPLAYGGVS